MTPDAQAKRNAIDPFKGDNEAALVAALPHEFAPAQRERLFARIYRYLDESDEYDTDDLVDGAEQFARNAFQPHKTHNEPGDPLVDAPAMLAVVAVLAATAVCNHDQLEATPPRRLKLFQQISDLYTTTLLHQFHARDYILDVDLAELVYDKDTLHAGRTCTGIVDDVEGAPGGPYIEIPLVAASPSCAVREADGSLGGGFDPIENDATGDLKTHIANNNVYIPAEDLYRQVGNQLEDTGFQTLFDAHQEFVSDASLRRFLGHESAITERIDRFLNAGQQDLVWTNWDPDARLVRVLRSAVGAQRDLEKSEAYPAKMLFEAIDRYDPEYDWEESVVGDVTSQRSLASRLAGLETDAIEIIETRARKPNLYRVGHSSTGARQIAFEDKEDLFELPCLQNIDDRLHEESPTRKDLYNMVRMLRWLPGYRPSQMDRDTFIEEMKEILQRYPWYDEQTSNYQIRYELDQTNTDGDPYLPLGCSNPDMERYCIGQEECPYSIYGSLPFPDEIYDQIDSDGQARQH
jgi:hypothetical protein